MSTTTNYEENDLCCTPPDIKSEALNVMESNDLCCSPPDIKCEAHNVMESNDLCCTPPDIKCEALNVMESNDLCSTPPVIKCEALNVMESLLPENSKEKYLLAYQNFIQWQNNKNTQSFSENVFMAYFKELSSKYKPSSLWCIYSMLKSTVGTKNGVDLKTYSNLSAYLKRLSDGFRSKKSKVLSTDDIEKFIKDAPDNQYLATKVALIFGVTGACKTQELTNITVKDVENHGQMFLVKIPITKNKIPRSFTIHSPFYEIVKKYESLRSPKAKNDRFFLNYQNGKCTCQPIGINKFGSMPKEIAKFLGLANAESYTGHSFRRTSATLLANSEADQMTLKRHGGQRSSNEAESCVEDSILNKKEIRAKIPKRLDSEAHPTGETPSTSNDSPQFKIEFNDWISPTYMNNEPSQITIEHESISVNNLSEETAMLSKTVNYNFTNCTFTNCFSK